MEEGTRTRKLIHIHSCKANLESMSKTERREF